MNHRTRLDWLYYWSVILRQGKLENEKIILKSNLKQIPGAGRITVDLLFLEDISYLFDINETKLTNSGHCCFISGWAMQVAMFLFLERNWEKDEPYLHQVLRYFTDTNYPLQILIFPEGTDFDTHSVVKSNSYAMKNNLPIYNHVLHPRLRGFTYCVEQLRTNHGIDAIYDVTVGYHGNLCRSEFDLAMGNFPHNVHFHIKRYPIDSIPESHEGLEKWCMQKWAEKEATLDKFYKDGKFVPEREEKSTIMGETSVRYRMMFWIAYWLTFLGVVVVLLYYYWWVRWYAVIVGTVFFLQSAYGGGFEMLQVRRHASTKDNHSFEKRLSNNSDQSLQNGRGKKHVL